MKAFQMENLRVLRGGLAYLFEMWNKEKKKKTISKNKDPYPFTLVSARPKASTPQGSVNTWQAPAQPYQDLQPSIQIIPLLALQQPTQWTPQDKKATYQHL